MNNKCGLAGARTRWKTKLMIALQGVLLNSFGRAVPGTSLQSAIQRFSKRFIGGYPYVIKLDIIDMCNLRCKMCYAKNTGEEVPLNNLLGILKQIGDVPIRLDLLGGEPLLREDIAELIRFAKSNTGIQEIVLYTNGTLATERIARELTDAGLSKVMVTFISHEPQQHDDFTGVKDSWNKTVAGIKNFIKAGVKTYTFTALHSENINDFEYISKYVRNEFNITPLFYQYVPQKSRDVLSVSPHAWSNVKHKVVCDYSPKHFEYIKQIITFCGRVCLGGYYVISIKSDGTVTPCPFMHDIRIGNVLEQNIWDIFANRYNCTEFCEFMSLPEECTKCSYKNLCGGGCKAGNKILFGSYLSKDCRCLGPWSEPVSSENMPDKFPTFF